MEAGVVSWLEEGGVPVPVPVLGLSSPTQVSIESCGCWISEDSCVCLCDCLFRITACLSLCLHKQRPGKDSHHINNAQARTPTEEGSTVQMEFLDLSNVRKLLVQMDGGPLDKLCYVKYDRLIGRWSNTIVWPQQTVRSSCWTSHRMGISLRPTHKRFNSAYLQSLFHICRKFSINTLGLDKTFSC